MEPQLSIVQQAEGSEWHSLVFRCAADMKIALVAVEPGEGITRAIKLREFELVRRHG
jgi:hypothetical protein